MIYPPARSFYESCARARSRRVYRPSYNSTFTLAVFSAEDAHSARTKTRTAVRLQDCCICIMYAIVFRETSVRTYERENSVCPPSPILPSSFVPSPSLSSARPPFTLSPENSTSEGKGYKERERERATLHLAPYFSSRWQLLAALGANSRRYRLPLPPFIRPYLVPTTLFTRCSFQGEKERLRDAASRSSAYKLRGRGSLVLSRVEKSSSENYCG